MKAKTKTPVNRTVKFSSNTELINFNKFMAQFTIDVATIIRGENTQPDWYDMNCKIRLCPKKFLKRHRGTILGIVSLRLIAIGFKKSEIAKAFMLTRQSIYSSIKYVEGLKFSVIVTRT